MLKHLARVAAVIAALVALSPVPAAAECPSGQVAYSLVNRCAYPLWIGQNADAARSQTPVGGTWELPLRGTSLVCAPRAWAAVRMWGRTGCTRDAAGHLACLTGQCGDPGRADCGAGAGQFSGANPQTLFEVTMLADGTTSWDVSVVNGANVPMAVEADGRCDRSTAGCTTDLNAVCPPALRKTVAPTAGGGPVPCGAGTSCPVGACVDGTCVLGCFAPFDACGEAKPPADLTCSAPIAGVPPYKDCDGRTGPVTYEQMYGLKNLADGVPMASPHQGTPTCLVDTDCPAARPRCVTSGFDPGIAPPPGAGVCINPDPAQQAANDYATPSANCATAPVGEACGGYREVGYPAALGYTCRRLTYTLTDGRTATAHPCVPPTTSGLGTCSRSRDPAQPPLYSGVGGVWNPGWMAAARQAGGGEEFFKIFRRACPGAYAWPYDDVAALYGCSSVESFTITFCPAELR